MDILTRTLCTFLQTILLMLILILPYRERLRYSILATVTILCAWSIFYTAPHVLLRFDAQQIGYWRVLSSCVNVFLCSAIVSYLTGINFFASVFSTFLLRNLSDSIMMGTRLLYAFWLPQTSFSYCIIPFVYLIWFAALTPVFIYFIRQDVKPNLDSASSIKAWRYLWSVPFTFHLFFRIFADVKYLDATARWNSHTIILPFIWFTGVIISHSAILKMIRETASVTALKEQLKYSSQIAEVQKREYSNLQDNIHETRKLRHDMRHHLIALDGYLEKDDVKAARQYIGSLIHSVDLDSLVAYCSNNAVNALLNHYRDKAVAEHIMVTYSINLDEKLPLPDTDFCTILGNLLENAFEACVRKGGSENYIKLNVGRAGNEMPVLSIRNTYSGDIRMKDGCFLSSKRDEAGTGTASVKYLVQKYNGICRFNYQDGIFEASVLLNLNGAVTPPSE